MEDAINELERISKDEKIIGLYDAKKVDAKIRNTQIEGARRDGIEEGIKQVAAEMLRYKMDIDLISKITGLSKELIDNLNDLN